MRTVRNNKTRGVKTINPSVESDLNRRISNSGRPRLPSPGRDDVAGHAQRIGGSLPCCAPGTGADPPQIIVRVDTRRVPIAPVELDRILPHGRDRERVDARVFRWVSLLTNGTRAPLPEIRRWVDGIVSVTPADANVPRVGTRDLERHRRSRRTQDVAPGRRPSCPLAHSPACTEVSAVGPSKRLTRMAGWPFLVTATRCRIEIVPSVGLYLSRS